jgi:hypothetical protein
MPEADKKISIVHTPCKECVFAVYDEQSTQTACKANMLDKFKSLGYEILDVYDNEKEFFVINNKKCMFMRSNAWLTNKKISDIDEALSVARDENNIKYILLLEIDGSCSQSDIETTIDKFCGQSIPPIGILVMVDHKHKLQINLNQIAKHLDNKKIKWRIQKFIDDEMNSTQKIKAIIQSAPMNRYYFYVQPQNFNKRSFDIQIINNKILDGLTFGCMNCGGALLFSYLSWQYAKNNQDIDILLDSKYHIKYENIK